MKIIDILDKTDIKKNEITKQVNVMLSNFNRDLQIKDMRTIIQEYYKECIPAFHKEISNNLNMKIYVREHKKISINDSKYGLNKNNKYQIRFEDSLFEKAALFEISLLYDKYKEECFEGQLKLSLMKLVFQNFLTYTYNAEKCVYEKEHFVSYLVNFINNILDMDTKNLIHINNTQTLEHIVIKKEKLINISKPTKADHLTGLWIPEMKRSERIKAVMDYWEVSKPTAIAYMRKFNVYEDADVNDEMSYKQKYEEALKEIERLKQENDDLKSRINCDMLYEKILKCN